uniref:FBD domain-containing protein n=1 Tax=Aegilops tauschii subsp. strangulata TaxID=200361 RepID=A0A453GUL7_AEGTS
MPIFYRQFEDSAHGKLHHLVAPGIPRFQETNSPQPETFLLHGHGHPKSDLVLPVLTDLRLVRFEGIRCLNIQAPKLEYLEVVGGFEDINLDAPNLEWAVLTLNPKAKAYQSVPIAHDTKNYVKKSLGSVSDIKQLAFFGFFLKVGYC